VVKFTDEKNDKVLEYLKTEGRPWLEVLLEISRGLPAIAVRKTPFMRWSKICGIYIDDE